MKQLLLILGICVAVITPAHAGELYICVDREGNRMITDTPQEGMKCEVKDRFEDSAAKAEPEKEKTAPQKDQVGVKSEAERVARINKCISCCDEKKLACYNYTANGRLCTEADAGCIAACKSEGASPSEWSVCWSQSAQ
ncbi:MAG: DUF4124 domain-containing protein [Deltaproteobacteria bacterium]|nr:DUF4124 domain-containing protein [Deltaproteobacteria bacterium]